MLEEVQGQVRKEVSGNCFRLGGMLLVARSGGSERVTSASIPASVRQKLNFEDGISFLGQRVPRSRYGMDRGILIGKFRDRSFDGGVRFHCSNVQGFPESNSGFGIVECRKTVGESRLREMRLGNGQRDGFGRCTQRCERRWMRFASVADEKTCHEGDASGVGVNPRLEAKWRVDGRTTTLEETGEGWQRWRGHGTQGSTIMDI